MGNRSAHGGAPLEGGERDFFRAAWFLDFGEPHSYEGAAF